MALCKGQAETAQAKGALSPAFATDVTESLPDASAAMEIPADALSQTEATQGPRREKLELVMDTTGSVEEAWEAYQHLFAMPLPEGRALLRYYSRLHRLARLLSKVKPRTRTLFLRLLSVVSTLHKNGGNIQTWEWNLLMDCAGKAWRKTRPEDFKAALDIYRNMLERRAPGSTSSRTGFPSSEEQGGPVMQPDIITYTTLLNIAGRTLQQTILRHARSMLDASGIPPNRITYLALIRYYSRKNDLTGVRAILSKMREQGMELGRDGLNACVWAYARAGRIDVASLMYRVVRHNLIPEDEAGAHDVQVAIRQLSFTEGLNIPATIKPDAITYYTLIQCYAYHGDFARALEVFGEMITVDDELHMLERNLPGEDPTRTGESPSMPAFRAIFLGFARHGGKNDDLLKEAGPLTKRLADRGWTLENLQGMFEVFLRQPHDSRPSERTVFWLLNAFDVLSGRDASTLQYVWEKLTERFGDFGGGRLDNLRRRIYEDEQNSIDSEYDDP